MKIVPFLAEMRQKVVVLHGFEREARVDVGVYVVHCHGEDDAAAILARHEADLGQIFTAECELYVEFSFSMGTPVTQPQASFLA